MQHLPAPACQDGIYFMVNDETENKLQILNYFMKYLWPDINISQGSVA